MNNKKNCFFTVATGNWNMFILPYIFSCLYFNRDSFVEVLTRNNKQDEKTIKILNEIFEDSFLIHELPQCDRKRNMPDSALRFIIEPEKKLEYTYIGDVDILILESGIFEVHKKIIESNGYYSNIVRPNTRRLTGLHCVKTIPYYEKTKNIRESIICSSGSDEEMLFQIIEKAIHNPLKNANIIRPIHGFHFSLMREPKGDKNDLSKPTWHINSLEYQRVYFELKASEEWKKIYPFFDVKYKNILRIAEENF